MNEFKKITLIFPNFKALETFTAIPHQPSLSLGYLVGMLDKHKAPFQLIDAAAENLSTNNILKSIAEFNPEYVGITSNISISYAAIQLSFHIRKRFPNIKIIMGGPYATSQDEMLIRKRIADIVVLGEGEYTLLDILRTDYDKLDTIKGISLRINNKYFTTGRRPFIDNLDALPIPKWEYFPKKGFTRSRRSSRMYPFITSRGCPYNCKNCTKLVHGRTMRYRSIQNMLEELDYLKSIGAQEISIEDDMFNLDLKRIKAFLREVIKRNYGFRVQLSNGIRADKVDLEFAHLLYAAGVYRVALGVESASQKVINFLGKGLNIKVVPESVKILKKAHLKVLGYFIMGIPIESYQSLLYNIEFATNAKFDIFVYLNLVLFPGTLLWDYAINHTDFNPMRLYKNINYQHSPLQFTTSKINSDVLKRTHLMYLVKAYLHPIRLLRYIETFYPAEFFRQIIRNVKMAVKRLLLPKIDR